MGCIRTCLMPDSTCWNVKVLIADRTEQAIVGADCIGKSVASKVVDSMLDVTVSADWNACTV